MSAAVAVAAYLCIGVVVAIGAGLLMRWWGGRVADRLCTRCGTKASVRLSAYTAWCRRCAARKAA